MTRFAHSVRTLTALAFTASIGAASASAAAPQTCTTSYTCTSTQTCNSQNTSWTCVDTLVCTTVCSTSTSGPKKGVQFSPASAGPPVVTISDMAGNPILVNGTPLTLVESNVATAEATSLYGTLSPTHTWQGYTSNVGMPSIPTGTTGSAQFLVTFTWSTPVDLLGAVWFSNDGDDLYGATNFQVQDAYNVLNAPAAPTSFCTAGTTTSGCNAVISATANPTAANTTQIAINVASVEGQKQGIYFYGVNNSGFSPVPWSPGSTSFLCVKGPTQRAGLQSSGGTTNACDGALSLDWDLFVANNPFAVGVPFSGGDSIFVQAWFRDPPAPKTTNLSNAITLTVQP